MAFRDSFKHKKDKHEASPASEGAGNAGVNAKNMDEVLKSIEKQVSPPDEAKPDESAGDRLTAPTVESAEDLLVKLKKLEAEHATVWDQLLRKQAEFENFRKRIEKEKNEFYQFATWNLIRELLPVLDGFERAIAVECPEGLDGFKRGMELVYKQLCEVLDKAGLKPIQAVGQKFDPHYHQALQHETSDEHEENTIVEEYQRGYMLNDRLLRPSLVKVVSPKSATSTEAQDPSSEGEEPQT